MSLFLKADSFEDSIIEVLRVNTDLFQSQKSILEKNSDNMTNLSIILLKPKPRWRDLIGVYSYKYNYLNNKKKTKIMNMNQGMDKLKYFVLIFIIISLIIIFLLNIFFKIQISEIIHYILFIFILTTSIEIILYLDNKKGLDIWEKYGNYILILDWIIIILFFVFLGLNLFND